MERYKVVLTGASGEIGKSVLQRLLTKGYTVLAQTTTKAKLADFSPSTGLVIIEADLASPDGCQQLISEVKEQTEVIQGFIGAAGQNHDKLLIGMEDKVWQNIMDLNLNANFYLVRGLLPLMLKNKYGRIVMVSSAAAAVGNVGQANYCASKAGLEGLVKVIANEYAPKGINANCVAPGFVKSPMTANIKPEILAQALQRVPLGRVAEPDEIAAVIEFLVTKESSYVTGQTWQVNGGLYLG